jgi:hypothetical protein
MEKQRREEMLRRRHYEEELARREREEEAYYQHMLAQKESMRQARVRSEQGTRMARNRDDEYVLVRGPGGMVYRVLRSDLDDAKREKSRVKTETPMVPKNKTVTSYEDEERTQPTMRRGANEAATPKETLRTKSGSLKYPNRKKKITVIVEDASDSEEENEDINSMWRNRHPGPGDSWMEPVQHPL